MTRQEMLDVLRVPPDEFNSISDDTIERTYNENMKRKAIFECVERGEAINAQIEEIHANLETETIPEVRTYWINYANELTEQRQKLFEKM